MSTRKDIVKLQIEVNGNAALKELNELNTKAAEIRASMKGVKRNTQEYIDKATELKKVERRMDEIRSTVDLSKLSMRELNKEIARLRLLKNSLDPGSQAFRDVSNRMEEAQNRMGQLRNNAFGLRGAFKTLKTEVKQLGVLFLAGLGIQELFGQMGNLIKRNAELSDALSDVKKTTGLTDTEVKNLSKNLGKMNTRTPRRELLALARDAGKLGITGQKNIESFVNAADKINVALGEDLGDGAIKSLGKLNALFKTTDAFGYEQAMLKTGSAINSLGQASTASEEFLVDFAKRMGGIAAQAGFTIDEVLGLGATLDQLGVTSEVSTTAIGKLFVEMAKNAEAFAEIAGVSVDEFTRLLEEDANEAFLKVLDGAKSTDKGLIGLSKTLENLGIEQARAAQVAGALTQNVDLLREQQAMANVEFEKGTSIIDEFNEKNNNLAANLAKFQRAFGKLFVNSALTKGINAMVFGLTKLITKTQKHSDSIEEERTQLNLLETQIYSTNTPSEKRIELIKKLQEMHPNTLGNIDAEKVSNKELAIELKKVNDLYLAKILIAKAQEEVDKKENRLKNKQKTESEKRIELIKLENQAITFLVDNYGLQRESLNETTQIIQELRDRTTNSMSQTKNIADKLTRAYTAVYLAEKSVENSTEQLSSAQAEQLSVIDRLKQKYPELADQLQVILDLQNGITGESTDTDPEGETDAERLKRLEEARLKRLEEERLKRLEEERLKREAIEAGLKEVDSLLGKYAKDREKSLLDANARELDDIDDKYKELVEKAVEFGRSTADIEGQWELEINEARARHRAEAVQHQEELIAQTEDFLQQIYELGLDAEELEIVQIGKRFDRLLELNDQYYADQLLSLEQYLANELALKEGHATALALINTEQAEGEKKTEELTKDEKIGIARNYFSTMTGLLSQAADSSYGFMVFQKLAGITQVIIDQSLAIAAATKAGAGLIFPANLPAITTGIAAVLSAIVPAAKAIKAAKIDKPKIPVVSQRADGGYVGVIGKERNKKYKAKPRPDIEGGLLSDPSLILAGEEGPEYFVNSTMLDNASVKAVVSGIDALSTGRIKQVDFNNLLGSISVSQRADGGFVGNFSDTERNGRNPSTGDTMREMMLSIISTQNRLNDRLDSGIGAYFGDLTIRDIDERSRLLQDIENQARG